MLIGTAGFAAAEVSVSGNARMGIVDDGGANGAVFSSRARVAFSMSGETDGGLSFGASLRADNAGAAAGGTAGSVSISGAFGSISMGDNDSAAQAGVGQVAGVGYTGNGDLNEIAYLGAGTAPNVLYTYSAGALTVMASVAQTTADNRSVAVAYAGEGFGVSFGVEDNGGADNHVVVGANASVSGIALKAVYGSLGNQSQYAISATYSADALSATVFTRSSLAEVQASGVGIGYDLGGGASFAAGYSKAENANGRFDAGVNFSF
jgi:outer membrane protein OmpU